MLYSECAKKCRWLVREGQSAWCAKDNGRHNIRAFGRVWRTSTCQRKAIMKAIAIYVAISAVVVSMLVAAAERLCAATVTWDFDSSNQAWASYYSPLAQHPAEPNFVVTDDASQHHGSGSLTGDGRFLMLNGTSAFAFLGFFEAPRVSSFTVSLDAASWLAGGDPAPAMLGLYIGRYEPGRGWASTSLYAPGMWSIWHNDWRQYYYTVSTSSLLEWSPGELYCLAITNDQPAIYGNDFALDNISLNFGGDPPPEPVGEPAAAVLFVVGASAVLATGRMKKHDGGWR